MVKKINKKNLLKIIKEWKMSQKIIDFTNKSLINLAVKIIEYETRRKNE